MNPIFEDYEVTGTDLLTNTVVTGLVIDKVNVPVPMAMPGQPHTIGKQDIRMLVQDMYVLYMPGSDKLYFISPMSVTSVRTLQSVLNNANARANLLATTSLEELKARENTKHVQTSKEATTYAIPFNREDQKSNNFLIKVEGSDTYLYRIHGQNALTTKRTEAIKFEKREDAEKYIIAIPDSSGLKDLGGRARLIVVPN